MFHERCLAILLSSRFSRPATECRCYSRIPSKDTLPLLIWAMDLILDKLGRILFFRRSKSFKRVAERYILVRIVCKDPSRNPLTLFVAMNFLGIVIIKLYIVIFISRYILRDSPSFQRPPDNGETSSDRTRTFCGILSEENGELITGRRRSIDD